MAVKMTRSEKIAYNKIEKQISAAYQAKCCNIAIPMMEIPAIFKMARAKVAAGASQAELEASIFEYVQKIAA